MALRNKLFKNKNNVQDKKITKYDVAIIGGGQTGLVLARRLIKKEMKVLVIDKGDLGIKTSLDLKNFTKLIKRMISKQQAPQDLISSFPQRLEFIRKEQNESLTSVLKSNSFFEFVKGNVETIDEYELTVDGKKYAFRKLVFATGSYFVEPTGYPNLTREMYFNLDEISKVDKFYKNVAIYGTDIQALELAYAFALLGSNVYIFDENVNPFNNFDDDFESILKTDFMTNKINWCLESKVTNHIKSSDSTYRIEYTTQGSNKYVEVDKIFITGNKKSEIRDLKTRYELEINSHGSIIIDNNFRVKNNPSYYAIGDVNGIRFVPDYANSQAIILSNVLTKQKGKGAKFTLFNTGFSIDIEPQISFFGMNKQELDYQGIKFNEFIYDFDYELNSKLFSHKSKLKVYTNEKHEILGVFLYGHKIKELLSIFILAANEKIKFHKLSQLNFPFYSKSEFIRDAATDYELEFVGLSKKLQKLTKKNNA